MVNQYLIETDFTCDRCFRSFRATAQFVKRQCKKCGKMFVFCDECKPKAVCDWCACGEFERYVSEIEKVVGPLNQ